MDAEVDDELRDHIERETEKYRRAGLTPNEAARRAHLALGGSEQVKQQSRDARGTKFVEDIFTGPSLCDEIIREDAGPHDADRAFAGDRHRREHSNLQHHQHAAAQALALSRP